ncbi:Type IV secretory pathway, VirB3-like protein [Wolbachia endosymbiont of Armadillidium vulgare]|nr:Type IV secretory pathway, VirB3-like protein [Wolbachia endosymbiont of Armadillidium vulgare]
MSTGSIQTDQLFKGLTRPAMLFGVSYMFAILTLEHGWGYDTPHGIFEKCSFYIKTHLGSLSLSVA